ncbi:unnamed protein product, partial [Closterium sp. Yama58-4]
KVGPVNCILKPRNRPRNWLNYRYRPKNCGQPWFAFNPLAFLQRMRNRVFASVGDSLSVSNLMPSLLCQLHQVSPVTEIPNDGTYAKEGPPTKVYRVKAFNITLVNTWSTFLNEYWQDEQTVQQYNGGVPLTEEDSVVNLDGLDAQWAAYIGQYDVLILQTQAHWQSTKYKWRRFWVNSTGDQIFNESRFLAAFEYGMEAIKMLLDQPEAPITYFISAPARLDGCKALKAPYTDAQVATIRKNNRQFVAWVFASAGDSLSYFNFIPSLLCQLHQASPVHSIPVPPRLAPRISLVYHGPQYNVTIVNTWSTFLNQCRQDKQTLAKYNKGRPVTPEDSVVNLEGVDWRWGRYLAKYDVLLLQSAAHWQPKRTRWRRFFTDRRGRVAYNESRFYRAFRAGMQSVKKLVDRANDKATRGSSSNSSSRSSSSSAGGSAAAAGNKWPVVFFFSAPTKQSGCAASFEPRTEGEVSIYRKRNPQTSKWLPLQRKIFAQSHIHLIDVTSASVYRPDAFVGSGGVNKDCVHWCLPGVPDSWVAMVLGAMLQERRLVGTIGKIAPLPGVGGGLGVGKGLPYRVDDRLPDEEVRFDERKRTKGKGDGALDLIAKKRESMYFHFHKHKAHL